MGDLFAPVLELKQRLPDLKKIAAQAAPETRPAISLAAQAEDEDQPQPPRKPAPKKATKRPPARKAGRKV
jgi:hypothetical protein